MSRVSPTIHHQFAMAFYEECSQNPPSTSCIYNFIHSYAHCKHGIYIADAFCRRLYRCMPTFLLADRNAIYCTHGVSTIHRSFYTRSGLIIMIPDPSICTTTHFRSRLSYKKTLITETQLNCVKTADTNCKTFSLGITTYEVTTNRPR